MKKNEFYAIIGCYGSIVPALGLHYNKKVALTIAKNQKPTPDKVVKVKVLIIDETI